MGKVKCPWIAVGGGGTGEGEKLEASKLIRALLDHKNAYSKYEILLSILCALPELRVSIIMIL